MLLHDWLIKYKVLGEDLAKRLGVTRNSLSRWRRLRVVPSMKHMLQIKEITGGMVDIADHQGELCPHCQRPLKNEKPRVPLARPVPKKFMRKKPKEP